MVLVRAIYQNGNLQLIDPVPLENGQEVQLHIVERPITTQELLDGLLATFDFDVEDFDEEATQKGLDEAMVGKRPLSEIIIEERREGR